MPQVETKIERQKRYFEHLQELERSVLENGKYVTVGNISFKDALAELESEKRKDFDEWLYCLRGQHFLRWWDARLKKSRSAIGSKVAGRPKKFLHGKKTAEIGFCFC